MTRGKKPPIDPPVGPTPSVLPTSLAKTPLDGALEGLLALGWGDSDPQIVPVEPTPLPMAPQTPTEPEYLPLPVRENPDGAVETLDDDEFDPPVRPNRRLSIGALTDLASGHKSPEQTVDETGLTRPELQAELAVTLRELPPDEVVKALGLQAVEQQLKSGAIYGVVLADLVRDMSEGRLKPETKIEMAKLLAKVGKLEPKEDKSVGAGSGFQLNIQINAADPQPITIQAD